DKESSYQTAQEDPIECRTNEAQNHQHVQDQDEIPLHRQFLQSPSNDYLEFIKQLTAKKSPILSPTTCRPSEKLPTLGIITSSNRNNNPTKPPNRNNTPREQAQHIARCAPSTASRGVERVYRLPAHQQRPAVTFDSHPQTIPRSRLAQTRISQRYQSDAPNQPPQSKERERGQKHNQKAIDQFMKNPSYRYRSNSRQRARDKALRRRLSASRLMNRRHRSGSVEKSPETMPVPQRISRSAVRKKPGRRTEERILDWFSKMSLDKQQQIITKYSAKR
ncbi:unnamed protein product, partial [Anisakis simplex]|uniref:Uncharacterized protein n=1 Tax=Anisakis simplex TaxID=6269 RepID=A0A0M3J925_ANISI